VSVLCRREGVRHLGYLKFRPVLNYYFDLVLLYFGLVLTIDPSPNTLDDLDLDLSKMTDYSLPQYWQFVPTRGHAKWEASNIACPLPSPPLKKVRGQLPLRPLRFRGLCVGWKHHFSKDRRAV